MMDTPSGSHLTHSLSKPLPSLPPASHFVNLSPPTPVLSTHSRNHLHAFLQRALVEEGLIYDEEEAENSAKAKTDDPHASQSEDKEQSWVTELEGALEELGRSIASGRWLAGLRKKRVDLKLRLDMLEKQQVSKHDEPSAKDQDSASRTGTVKAEHVDLEAQQPDGMAGLRLSRASARTNSTVELSMNSEAEHRDTVLRHLGTLVLRPVNDTNETTSMHLLLAISPFSGALVRTRHDSGLDHVGSKIGCSFSPHHFNLTHEGKIGGTILFGVNEWSDELMSMSDSTLPINIVGGTFTLNGVTSKAQYDSLCHILRLALFTIMSLLLEQQLLLDSHNAVRYPPPPTIPVQSPPAVRDTSPSPPPLSPQSPSPIPSSPTLEMPSRRKVVTSGIWSYLAKKKEGLFARLDSPTSDSTSPRGGSLDIRPPSSVVPTSPPLLSEGGDLRRRTLSFLGVVMPRPMIPRPPPSPPIFNPSEEQVFTTTLQRLKLSIVVLSTTPGSAFDPPSLITRLAQMEANDPRRRTTGDDVTALRSLSGWSGANRIARAKELSGVVAGFVRFQTFVALYSEHVPIPVEPWEPLEPSGSDADSETSSLSHTPAPSEAGTATSSVLTNPASGLSATSEPSGPSSPPRSTTLGLTGQDNSHPRSRSPSQHRPAPDKDTLLTQCTARRRLIAYSYYSRKANEDVRLGSAVEEWCRDALKPCSKPNCKFLRGEHELRWIHAGIRITLQKHFPDEELEEARERNAKKTSEDQSLTKYEPEYDPGREMQVWARCKVCGKETERSQAGDGTHLLSFAKLLEMLVYSSHLCELSSELCEHTNINTELPTVPNDTLPPSRFSIVRFFGYGSRSVSFSLSRVEDIFELRVPQLQIIKSNVPEKPTRTSEQATVEEEEEKRELRNEIKIWWQGIADHLDKLEEQFETMEPVNRKALPRLPSVDEAYVLDEEEVEEHPTPKPAISGLPDVSTSGEYDEPKTPTATAPSSPRPDIGKRLPTDKTLPRDKALPVNSFALLARLRHSLQKVEQKLYADLARTPTSTLNDTRRAFRSTAKGATKRIHAWQDKHLPKKRGAEHAFSKLITPEPSWWSAQCYAVPGGSVIVHEEDWGSIIAFTLSCTDYMRELANFTNSRTSTAMSEMTQMSSMAPSFATSTPTSPLPTPGTPGPILKLSYFTAPFRTNPRPDPDQDDDIHWQDSETCSAVISRQEYRDPTYLVSLKEALLSKRPASGASGSITSQLMSRGSLKGPNGTPASAWAKPAVEVSLQAVDGVVIEPIGGETAEKLRHELEESSTDRSSILSASSASASEFVETHLRRGKLASLVSAESDSESEATESGIRSLAADNKIPSDSPSAWKGRNDDRQARPSSEPGADLDHDRAEAQSMSITSSLSQAMRMVLRAGDTLRSFPTSSNPNSKTHHALLSVDSLGTVDDRPHLKHDFTVGKMRFSCTVYYAKQFDTLRRKCGIEDVFVQSMRKSANWAADGGKSKSNFWKTSDDRFIIKTLVNAWNVADLQVLLELGPAYFRYMNQTASRATVLAKLFGFYTVEVRNLESGATQHKADLVVMENLFHQRKIAKTFDLKGIQGRKVKAKGGSGAKTLFDEEWMEGQQRALMLVHPHSKAVLEESVRNDCEFLADSNIMDYSLLLGIDTTKKQIVCGLVDTIGSYTFAKTLEYKAKQGLNSGKQVTVVPPDEYRKRFVRSMDDYFLPCPDKWTRPADGSDFTSDPWSLDSVF